MGTFAHSAEIGDFNGRRFETVEALVDTGATYSSVPRDRLERLGVAPEEEREFELANGQIASYGIAWIRMRLEGREQPTLAIFGDEGSEPLIGAFTLEGFGLAVDAVNHRLVPARAFLVGIRERR